MTVTVDMVTATVERMQWPTVVARKRGRDSRFPYVPVLRYPAPAGGGKGYEKQIRARAFVTADAAVAHGERVVRRQREVMVRDLLDPAKRALREHHGLPRELDG